MKDVDVLSLNTVRLTRSHVDLITKIKIAQQEDKHIQAIKKLFKKDENS